MAKQNQIFQLANCKMNKIISPYIEEACEKIVVTYTFHCGCKETHTVANIIESLGKEIMCNQKHIRNNIIDYEIGENL